MENTTSVLMTVTPQMAEDWLNHAVYERQRRRAEWHVKRLAIEMEKGRFIAGSQIHFGILANEMKLVNGQHTLAAIVKTRGSISLTVLRTVVGNEKELGQLYSRHDRHRGRTPHDVFLGMGLANELQLEEIEINSFAPALKWVVNGFRRPSVQANPEMASLDWLASRMTEWSQVARTYFDSVRDARHGMKAAFRRAPVVAVGLATIKHKKERALEFWQGAVADDGLHKLDPRRALNQFLTSNSSGYGDPVIYMRNVAGAWNKFYDDGEMQFLRPGDTGKIGVTIRGTPYKAQYLKAVRDAEEAEATTRMKQTSFGEARP